MEYNSDLISALQPAGVEYKGNGEGVAGSQSTTKAPDEQEDAFPYTKRDGLQVSKALRRCLSEAYMWRPLERGSQDAQQRSEVTFEKPEPLEEVCTDEGVAEIEQKSTEEHPFTVDID
ncbi:hypothetical protein EK904_007544 [Melospiza melodia maxima]|nr:hypothetical protein EK904_007544 [Melospiza melodia maxima]